jgi:hypothetical protein
MGLLHTIEECAFEPESAEIRCVDCGKPTGEIGTCQDVGFCTGCRAAYVAQIGEAGFSEMLITMIEGRGYNSRYKPRRVLHLSVNSSPACGIKGGPHPVTANNNEVNCKRCITKGATHQ